MKEIGEGDTDIIQMRSDQYEIKKYRVMQLQYGDCKKEEIGNETMIEMLDCEVTKRKCDDVRKVEKTRGELEKVQ